MDKKFSTHDVMEMMAVTGIWIIIIILLVRQG